MGEQATFSVGGLEESADNEKDFGHERSDFSFLLDSCAFATVLSRDLVALIVFSRWLIEDRLRGAAEQLTNLHCISCLETM
jgi:hypothetical protein